MAAATANAVAKRYFAATTARDVDEMVACWKPGGREHVRGMFDGTAPGDVRAFFENLFSCFGIEGGLPPELAARWGAAAPGADGDARLLQPSEVLDLLEKIRAVPGVTEAAARIVAR